MKHLPTVLKIEHQKPQLLLQVLNVYKRIKINDTADNKNMCVVDNTKGTLITIDDNRDNDGCRWNYDPVTQQLKNKGSGYCINNNKPGGTANDLIQSDCDPNEVANKFNYDKNTKRYESVKNPESYLYAEGWQPGADVRVYPGEVLPGFNKWETAWYLN